MSKGEAVLAGAFVAVFVVVGVGGFGSVAIIIPLAAVFAILYYFMSRPGPP
jgi:hypothetical protein